MSKTDDMKYFTGVPTVPEKKKLSYWEEQQKMHKRIEKSDDECQDFRARKGKRRKRFG